ncbi:CPBP family intramembrane metalloprotease [Candidatus Poribacteria bacterium]|nr:CPBP family intramembrane metalloprotease [Candidatus Poribacteria bacterium]
MKIELVPYFTFQKIRARTLVWCSLLSLFLSSAIYTEINTISYNNETYNLPGGIYSILFYSVFILIISSILFRSRLSYRNLFGGHPAWLTLARYSILTIPLVSFSIAIIIIQYHIGMALVPEFTEWLFEDNLETYVSPVNKKLLIANIISIFNLTIITPIFEEFFFRGILLTRWSIKWNTSKAIFVSSILFGILHSDIIGKILFGYVLAILYIKTRSLYVPICIHIINNTIAIILQYYSEIALNTSLELDNIPTKTQIWFWIIVLIIVIGILFNFLRKNIPNKEWIVPYLINHGHENNLN